MASMVSLRIILNKIKWILYEDISSTWDFISFLLNLPTTIIINGPVRGKKIILYVGEFIPPRIPRIAKWSKRFGNYSTILLCHKRGYYEKLSNEDIDQTILFRNKWHLKRIIKSLPQVYIAHGFAPKSKAPCQAMQFLNKYQPHIPFVADYQDVLVIYYGTRPSQRWLKHELPYEKLCMQYADGIIANSLEPREAMKLWNIKTKNKRLFFPIYCDNDSFSTPKKTFAMDDIHMVYAGGIAGSHRDKRYFGDTQLSWLIEYLAQQKIHFHIYPSPTVQKADYQEYEQIARQNDFFHFHQAVSQTVLSQELSQYHYGLLPFFGGSSNQSELKAKYATTVKLFNYAEAGIPIIAGAGVTYQSWIIERYKLGLVIKQKEDFKNIRKYIEEKPYSEQIKTVSEQREALSLQKHIPRLIKFYEGLRSLHS